MADAYGVRYLEVSAKTGDGVVELFEQLAKDIVAADLDRRIDRPDIIKLETNVTSTARKESNERPCCNVL